MEFPFNQMYNVVKFIGFRLSLRATNVNTSKHDPIGLSLPNTKDLNWSNLVDTSSKAVLQSSSDENPSSLLSSITSDTDLQWVDSSNEFHFSMVSGTEYVLRDFLTIILLIFQRIFRL